jgi:hypothetical protein
VGDHGAEESAEQRVDADPLRQGGHQHGQDHPASDVWVETPSARRKTRRRTSGRATVIISKR